MSDALVAPRQVRGIGRLREQRPLAIFASSGDDERRRRPADVFALSIGLAFVLAAALERDHPTPVFRELTQFLQALPEWIQTLLGASMAGGAIYVVLVLVLAVVAADRRGLVRDLLVGVVLAVATGLLVARLVEGAWPSLGAALDSGRVHFPVARVALVTGLTLIALPHIIKPVRRLGHIVVFVTVVGAVALQFGNAAQVLGGFGVGLFVAAAVHLIFGSPAGAPSRYHIQQALDAAGITVGRLQAGAPWRGWSSRAPRGGPARRARGRQGVRPRRRGFAIGREDVALPVVPRQRSADREPAATDRARGGRHVSGHAEGARTPDVVAMVMTDRGDAVLVLKPPPGLSSVVQWDEDHLESVWRQLVALRAGGVAHGWLDSTSIELDGAGDVVIDHLTYATVSARPGAAQR